MDKINTLYVMIGVAGSGKSTYAVEFAKSINALLVQSDEIRKQITGSEGDMSKDPIVWGTIYSTIKYSLKHGDVVFDATNRTKKNRKQLLKIARDADALTKAIVINTPLDECLRRNANRERNVPEDVIKMMHSQLEIPEEGEFDEVQIIETKA